MPNYTYKALDQAGKERKGTINVANIDKVKEYLIKEKLIPISITEAGVMQKDLSFGFLQKKPKPRDLSVFCRQFVSIMDAGVPIVSTLEMLAEQTENKMLTNAILETKRSVEVGESLTNAMAVHKRVFSDMFISMIEAGEASGSLSTSFTRMAEQYEKDAQLKGLIKKATIYPIIVCIVAVVVVIAMLIFVIPTFEDMFNDLGTELPGITKFMLTASEFMQSYWYIVIGVIIGLVLLFNWFKKTKSGKYIISSISIKIPLVKNLVIKTAASRFARTLSTLLGCGLPLLDALTIVASTMTNVLFRDALLDAKDSIAVGSMLSEPISRAKVFPPLVKHMIKIGEETGDTEKMLTKLADYYDEEVKTATASVMAALEPMIIIMLAGVIGTIVLSVMLPIANMYQGLENL